MTGTTRTIIAALRARRNPERAAVLQRFFKTGPGEYGAGDRFLGVTVPEARTIVRAHRSASLRDIEVLLAHAYHEVRLVGALLLVEHYRHGDPARTVRFYLDHASRINNWDLVDLTAPHILGDWLRTRNRSVLDRLAQSSELWERRIAIVSTLALIRNEEYADTFRIVEILLGDAEDLIHKACGWMLREVGKRDEDALRRWLDQHGSRLPRTALRYAIERFPAATRHYYRTTTRKR